MEPNPFYPKCKYHPVQAAVVVNSEAEEKALGAEWHDFPDMTDRVDKKPKQPILPKKQEFRAEQKAE